MKAEYRPKPFTANPKSKEVFDRQKTPEAYISNDIKMYKDEFIKSEYDEPVEWDEDIFKDYEESLFRFIDYAEKEIIPSKEELDAERRRFSYFRKGHKAGRLRIDNLVRVDTLLTAPMIFYIMLTPHSSKILGEAFNVSPNYIKKLKAGIIEYWRWEYDLVRRITNTLRQRSINKSYTREGTSVYLLWHRPNLYEEGKSLVYVCSSESSAKKARRELAKRIKNEDLISLYYPIEKTYFYR